MDASAPREVPGEKLVGGLAPVLGVVAGLFLLFAPTGEYETVSPDGTSQAGTTSGIDSL